MIKQATKKPVTINYLEWTGKNAGEVEEFVGDSYQSWLPSTEQIELTTLEGTHFASKGDLIIQGVNGEFYPCKPDIFAKTYDLVQES